MQSQIPHGRVYIEDPPRTRRVARQERRLEDRRPAFPTVRQGAPGELRLVQDPRCRAQSQANGGVDAPQDQTDNRQGHPTSGLAPLAGGIRLDLVPLVTRLVRSWHPSPISLVLRMAWLPPTSSAQVGFEDSPDSLGNLRPKEVASAVCHRPKLARPFRMTLVAWHFPHTSQVLLAQVQRITFSPFSGFAPRATVPEKLQQAQLCDGDTRYPCLCPPLEQPHLMHPSERALHKAQSAETTCRAPVTPCPTSAGE